MAHTTHSIPNTVYYLNGTNDLDFTGDGVRTRVYAITNLGSWSGNKPTKFATTLFF